MIGCPNCGCQDYEQIATPVRSDRTHVAIKCECQVCFTLFSLVNQDNGDPYTIQETRSE